MGSNPSTRSTFIYERFTVLVSDLILVIVGPIQQQWFFANFNNMTTEDATEKVKFSTSSFFSTYGATLYHVDSVYRPNIKNINDTTRRADAARSEAERIGGKFTVYWTFGKYDGVGILEAPNDEADNGVWVKSW